MHGRKGQGQDIPAAGLRQLVLLLFFTAFMVGGAGLLAAEDPYTAVGQGRGDSEEAADAAAVQAALSRIIEEPGLRELFVDEWYSSLEIQERELVRKTKKEAEVRITVRVNPVTLNQAERKYESIVIRKLNRAEELLSEMEKKMDKGESGEENGRLEEAYVAYRQAEAKGSEAQTLLQSFTGASFQSDQGYNRRAVLDRLKSLQTALGQGLQRLDEYSEDLDRDEQAKQRRKLFAELRNRQAEMGDYVDKMAGRSPFRASSYREDLEGWLVDVKSRLQMVEDTLEPQYRELENAAGEDSFLFLRKISLAQQELETQEEKLRQFRKELKEEIRAPYAVRRERARQRAEFWKGVGDFFLTHESRDRIALEYTVPAVFCSDDPRLELRSPLDFRFRMEGALSGLWIRSLTTQETLVGMNGDDRVKTLEQQMALGFGDDQIKALGFGWDWQGRAGEDSLPEHYRISAYLVGMCDVEYDDGDEEEKRAEWVISLQYQLPHFGGGFVLPYYLNVDSGLMARLGKYIVLEGRFRSLCWEDPEESWAGDGPAKENLLYWRDGTIGAGFRFPGPFLWKVRYVNEAARPLGGPGSETLDTRHSWEAAVEYSF